MKKKLFVVLGVLVILTLALAACGNGGDTGGSSSNGGSTTTNSSDTNAAQPANVAPAVSESDATEDEWPTDVPRPEDAYDIDVARGGTQITFKSPGDIENIVGYFQDELDAFGWGSEVTPDSAVGSMATMLRKNDAGETMSINIQYNELGDFVTLTMAIIR